MYKKNRNIITLIRECEKQLREKGYSEACITIHRGRWQQGIQQYMYSNAIVEYSEDVGE